MSGRFVDISEEEIVHLEQSKDSLNTKRTIKRSVNIFREFLGPENAQFEELPKYILDNKLRNFYASLRTTKGDKVKKSTLHNIKYGLGKYLKDTCKIDIQTDSAFESSRKTFKAKLTDLQKKGKGAVVHKKEISKEDLQRLMQPDSLAFNCDTPVGLQNKVWFDIMFHLCRRGQENLRDMKKSTFIVKTDSCGREYVSQAIDEADKNHGCDTGPDDTVGEGRMYAQPGSVMCPVKSFKDYLEKLSPDINDLWQRPRDSFNPNDTIWFCKCPLGKNSLAKMMSTISSMAGLSTRYTNHCIRATCISVLDRAGFEARHIIRASGHKSEQSVKSYACRLTEETQRKMSDALSTTITPQTSCGYTPNTGTEAVNIPLESLPELTTEDLNIIFSSENDFQDLSNQQVELQNNNDHVTRMNNAQFLNVPQHGLYHINPTLQNCEVHFHFHEK